MKSRSGPGSDRALFGPAQLPALTTAVCELSWLQSRGYSDRSSLKLVGDRHDLVSRQRTAVQRCSCPDAAVDDRRGRRLPVGALRGRRLAVDGFNAIILVETALAGAVVLVGRDGCCRDLASVHGSYRQARQTDRALELLGQTLTTLAPDRVDWCLDRPVSNSGRLGALMEQMAHQQGWPWSVELRNNPDRVLAEDGDAVVISSDAWVLDNCAAWSDLVGHTLRLQVPDAWLLDLGSAKPIAGEDT